MAEVNLRLRMAVQKLQALHDYYIECYQRKVLVRYRQ